MSTEERNQEEQKRKEQNKIKMLEKLKELKTIFSEITDIWYDEIPQDFEDKITKGFPFAHSFDEMSAEVSRWEEEAREEE